MGFFIIPLHTNKHSEVDCFLDVITPGVSPPPHTWERAVREAPLSSATPTSQIEFELNHNRRHFGNISFEKVPQLKT